MPDVLRRRALLLASLLGLGTASPAQAQPSPPVPDDQESERELPADEPLAPGEQRERPDYDGRGEEPTTAGDVALWVPRVLFSPLYFVSEYVVRRPLGALTTAIEKEKVLPKVFDFFTFGPDNSIGFAPTGYVDFGFRPSVGIYFFWNDFLAKDNDLRARAATWGPDWLRFSVKDRVQLGGGHELTARAEFLRRSDWVFHGVGPESGEDEARFQSTQVQAGLLYEARELWRSSSFSSYATVRSVRFELDEGCCDEPTVAQAIARGRYAEPFGADGYTIFVQGAQVTLDTRRVRLPHWLPEGSDYVSPNASGLRVQLRGEQAGALSDKEQPVGSASRRSHWLRYGASLGGYLDLYAERVVGVSLLADFADPVASDTGIPFTELVSLGGERPLRGYLQGRLLGRSSAVAQLDYQWPLWMYIDGAFHYAVGNVFSERLEGFEAKLLRQSFGLALRSTASRDHVLEILLAFGTRTFDDGGGVEHVRFAVGATSGF